MSQLGIVRASGILLIVFGAFIAALAIAAYPIGNSAIDMVQTTSTSYLNQASLALSNSQDMINSVQTTLIDANTTINVALPALSNSANITSNAATTLNSVGSTISQVGSDFSSITILGINPLSSVGGTITSIQSPIQDISNNLQGISSSLNDIQHQATSIAVDLTSINNQLSQFKDSLSKTQNSLEQTTNSLPTYFGEAKLALLLVVIGFIALSVILIVAGVSTLQMRKELIETKKRLEERPH